MIDRDFEQKQESWIKALHIIDDFQSENPEVVSVDIDRETFVILCSVIECPFAYESEEAKSFILEMNKALDELQQEVFGALV